MALCDSLYSDFKSCPFQKEEDENKQVTGFSDFWSFKFWLSLSQTHYLPLQNEWQVLFCISLALVHIQLTFNNSLAAGSSHNPVGMCWALLLWQSPNLLLQSNISAAFFPIQNILLWPVLLFLLPTSSSLLNKSYSPIPPLKNRIDFQH